MLTTNAAITMHLSRHGRLVVLPLGFGFISQGLNRSGTSSLPKSVDDSWFKYQSELACHKAHVHCNLGNCLWSYETALAVIADLKPPAFAFTFYLTICIKNTVGVFIFLVCFFNQHLCTKITTGV